VGTRRRVTLIAALIILAVVAAACGARFEDEGNAGRGGLGAGDVSSGNGDTTGPGDTVVEGGDAGETTTTVAGGSVQGTSTTAAAGSIDPGSTQGISDKTIKIGYLLPISGAAPVPQSFSNGVNAYYDDVNRKGGVNGRKIEVIVEDTQSQASVGKNRAQKLIEQDKVFTIVVLDRLENQKAIEDYLESRHFPNIEIQAAPDLAKSNYKWTFGVTIDHVVQGRLIADYLVRVLKVNKANIVYENTPILQPGADAFKAEMSKLGGEVVVSRTIDANGHDYASEALALSRSGAPVTWLYMAPTPAAELANQADGLGYHPTWFANSISWAFDLIFAVAPKALAGARAFSPWLPVSDSRADAYKAAYKASNPNETPDDLGLIGWGVGQIVVQGLRGAGANLGQNTFRESMQSMRFRPDVWAPLTFGPGVRLGADVVAVLKESGGKWVLDRDFTGGF
jgi:branched-chain amino acid transport system substrate-binding protein